MESPRLPFLLPIFNILVNLPSSSCAASPSSPPPFPLWPSTPPPTLLPLSSYARITRKGNDCGITTDPVFALVEAAAAEEAQAQAAVAH